MELNSIVFPAPSCSYTPSEFKTLLFLPRHPPSTIQSFTKCFESVQVKASILDETEAKLQLSSRELTVTKKFENNVKVKASILSNNQEKEIIKSFNSKQRDELIMKNNENEESMNMISSDNKKKNWMDEKESRFVLGEGNDNNEESISRGGCRGRAISSYRSSASSR